MNPERSIFDEIDDAADALADAAAIAEIEAGQFVSHEAVETWLSSWGSLNKLPPPKAGD